MFSLFHDLLSAPMFHHSVWSAITAHKLTPAKRDVNTVVSDRYTRIIHCRPCCNVYLICQRSSTQGLLFSKPQI